MIPGLDDDVPKFPGKRKDNRVPLEDRGSIGHDASRDRPVIKNARIIRKTTGAAHHEDGDKWLQALEQVDKDPAHSQEAGDGRIE